MEGIERECPLCGDRMQFVSRESVSKIPGSPQEVRKNTQEWVCRECDYFEEVEDSSDSE